MSIGTTARAAIFAQYVSGSYTQGTIYSDDSGDIDSYDMTFNNPAVVGDPTTSTTAGLTDLDYGYPEVISPFNPPADADQIVTIGSGGSITLQFNQPVNVLSSTPTLGVFTGIGFYDSQYPIGLNYSPAETFDTQSAVVSVSQNGQNWVSLGFQNFNIPENYYVNAGNPYQFPAPNPAQLADFGKAYTGTFDQFDGENFSQILTTLNGSAGGTWLNLAGTGLNQINYIQFSEPTGRVPVTSFVAIETVSASGLPANGNITLGGANSSQNVQLAAGVGPTTVASLVINTGSTLDLTTNELTIDYSGGADPIATIESYLADGGILSSSVASLNASQKSLVYSIGYADGADGLIAGLSSGEIEIMPTLDGDAKLQGTVDFGDFQVLSQYFGNSGGWDEGNFTGGATIDFGDFQLLAQNFTATDAALTASQWAAVNQFAAQAVPEPAGIGLLAVAGLLLRRYRKSALWMLIAAILISVHPAFAAPVDSIPFADGNVLNIQGVYGSGADSAYLVIDFDSPSSLGGNYAWQFNYDPSTIVNGWQMLEAIAGSSVLSTSPATTVTDVSNPAGDPNLTVTATYYTSFAEHLIEQLQYGATVGTSSSWDFDIGTYSAAAVSSADPQGTSWTSPGVGIDDENLSDGELFGFVNITKKAPTPTLPETVVPEPAGMMALALPFMLRRRARRA
ncbi:MAG TPA: hypothetical protein VL992_02510 [Tepidisphaeraceae bacterium]|nr:hypothetical protein [Tepidisphaeraceae bacterium]